MGAVALEIVLRGADAGYIASDRAVARSTRFLVINAKVGIVSQKVKVIAESFDHRAGEILRPRQCQIVKRLIDHCERPVFAAERRKVDFRAANSRKLHRLRR